jgi:NAD(P)H-quinone oxidoreductase subunit H
MYLCIFFRPLFSKLLIINRSEQLENIQAPKKVSYIRVIILELNCIPYHLLWLIDIDLQTPFCIFLVKEN